MMPSNCTEAWQKVMCTFQLSGHCGLKLLDLPSAMGNNNTNLPWCVNFTIISMVWINWNWYWRLGVGQYRDNDYSFFFFFWTSQYWTSSSVLDILDIRDSRSKTKTQTEAAPLCGHGLQPRDQEVNMNTSQHFDRQRFKSVMEKNFTLCNMWLTNSHRWSVYSDVEV